MLNLVTAHGELDVNLTPTGTAGYEDLHTSATTFSVGQVQVASLADVIRSKTAAGRGKDLDALPELHRLAGISNTAKSAVDAQPRSALELAQAGCPEPVQPVTAQELAQARIDAARRL